MDFKLDRASREELQFGVFDSTRDIIEVNGRRQNAGHLHGMGLWRAMIEVALVNRCIPSAGLDPEFERLAAYLEHYEVERQDDCFIYRLTF